MTEKLVQAVCEDCGAIRPSAFKGDVCAIKDCTGICEKTVFLSDATPNDKIRDMAEEFREEYQRRKDNGTEQRAWGIAHERCADELEELIDDD